METLVFSFGLNNRSQRDKNTPVTELKKALKKAQEEFPDADIHIPIVNFSSALPQNEQETLLHLNTFISDLDNHIPAQLSPLEGSVALSLGNVLNHSYRPNPLI